MCTAAFKMCEEYNLWETRFLAEHASLSRDKKAEILQSVLIMIFKIEDSISLVRWNLQTAWTFSSMCKKFWEAADSANETFAGDLRIDPL